MKSTENYCKLRKRVSDESYRYQFTVVLYGRVYGSIRCQFIALVSTSPRYVIPIPPM